MQKIKLSRHQQFIEFEKITLKPLPPYPFEYRHHKQATVHIDYHVEIDKHYYSVPYTYMYKKVDVYLSENTVEVFYQGERIALHQRCHLRRYRFSTLDEHMPPHHKAYREELNDSEVEKLLAWAKPLGDVVFDCVRKFFQTRAFPQQGIRAVLGLKRLHKQYGHHSFVSACQKSLIHNRFRCQFIEEALKHDLIFSSPKKLLTSSISHCRGKTYFQ